MTKGTSGLSSQVYRVFQNKKDGNRFVLRNTETLEGYDVISFKDGSKQTDDFTKALNLSRDIRSTTLKASAVSPNEADAQIDAQAVKVDLIAGFREAMNLIEDLASKNHGHHADQARNQETEQ